MSDYNLVLVCVYMCDDEQMQNRIKRGKEKGNWGKQ